MGALKTAMQEIADEYNLTFDQLCELGNLFYEIYNLHSDGNKDKAKRKIDDFFNRGKSNPG